MPIENVRGPLEQQEVVVYSYPSPRKFSVTAKTATQTCTPTEGRTRTVHLILCATLRDGGTDSGAGIFVTLRPFKVNVTLTQRRRLRSAVRVL